MKQLTFTLLLVFGLLSTCAAGELPNNSKDNRQMTTTGAPAIETAQMRSAQDAPYIKKDKTVQLIDFRPRTRGAPSSRIGGGVRGGSVEST